LDYNNIYKVKLLEKSMEEKEEIDGKTFFKFLNERKLKEEFKEWLKQTKGK